MREVVQGLWIGERLSTMERLSIASFLHHGHDYHLYTYGEVAGVPEGTTLRDGDEILPKTAIFTYVDHKSYAAFSNFFRYKLLLTRGGWWADTDMICLKPLNFDSEHVFASEWFHGVTVTSGLIKAPKGSAAMAHAWGVCQEKDPAKLTWGEVGPRLVGETVTALGLTHEVRPPLYFCPHGYEDWARVLEESAALPQDPCTFTIHLWNEMWRRNGVDKDARFAPGCPYEILKSRYLGVPVS